MGNEINKLGNDLNLPSNRVNRGVVKRPIPAFQDFEPFTEGFEYIISKIMEEEMFDTITIPLKNKPVYILRVFMLQSTEFNVKREIDYEKMYRIFNVLELNVDESNILKIMIGETSNIPILEEDLPDYFFLFKGLGLESEMKTTLKVVKKRFRDFKSSYHQFKRISKLHENETIQSWFSPSEEFQKVEQVSPTTFDNSLSFVLFKIMHKFMNELDSNDNLLLVDRYLGTRIRYHLKKFDNSSTFLQHKDFNKIIDLDFNNLDPLFQVLRRGESSNILLISSDKKGYPVHREILVLRTNFFLRMFRFGGGEMTEMKETGCITLNDISSDICELLLDYIYLKHYKTNIHSFMDPKVRLDVILQMIIHSDKFCEKDLFNYSLEKLDTSFPVNNNRRRGGGNYYHPNLLQSEQLRDVLYPHSHLLYNNKKVLHYIIPRLQKISGWKVDENKLRKYIRQGFRDYQYQQMEIEMRKKFEELEVENKVQKKKIKSLENRVERLEEKNREDLPIFGGGVRRKRDVDDDDGKEEQRKKRRKL